MASGIVAAAWAAAAPLPELGGRASRRARQRSSVPVQEITIQDHMPGKRSLTDQTPAKPFAPATGFRLVP
jgi:hypothetical protein